MDKQSINDKLLYIYSFLKYKIIFNFYINLLKIYKCYQLGFITTWIFNIRIKFVRKISLLSISYPQYSYNNLSTTRIL